MFHPDLARVEILVLPDHRLTLLRFRGEVRTAMLIAEIQVALASHPEADSYDCVCDLRQHTGHLGVEGMNALVGLRPAARPSRRKILLTRDAGMVFTVRYLNHLSPETEHSISAEPAEAVARASGGMVPAAALAFLTAP